MVTNEGEVPEGTVFEVRGAEAKPADGPELTPEEADALIGGADFLGENPGGEEAEPEAEAEAEAAEEPKKAAKIRIGGRSFDNQEEAFAYAEELEREKLAADAFRHGLDTAAGQQKGNPQPEVPAEPEENFEEEFFSNPKEYLKKFADKIKTQVETTIEQKKSVRERNEETWKGFYSDYPDLEGSKDLVNMFLNQHWANIQHMDVKPGLKIVADAVRERRRAILNELAPGIELPKTKATASPSGRAGVTQKAAPKKDLNFAQQMRQNNLKKRNPAPAKR